QPFERQCYLLEGRCLQIKSSPQDHSYFKHLLSPSPAAKRSVPALNDDKVTCLARELSTSRPINPVEHKLRQFAEVQAADTLTPVAIQYEDQHLTYAQPSPKASRLAHMLSQQGICPDSVVAICFERGIPQTLAILPILKGGGTIPPLDPDDSTLQDEMLFVDMNAEDPPLYLLATL
ncbi:hypothetical protein BDM02DRAFT_3133450, partial [Thelephora ganbajun]